MLNNTETVEDIKKAMHNYKQENDNGVVSPIIRWDAMKAVMRGKLIWRLSHYKKIIKELNWTEINELKNLEHNYKNTNDPNVKKQINDARKVINEILEEEQIHKTNIL